MPRRRITRAERDHRDKQMGWHYEEKRIEWARQELSWRGTLDFAHSAIRGAMLLNGAAAVALMAFLGSSQAREHAVYSWAPSSLMLFAVGTALAVVTGGFSYLAQKRYTEAADLAPSGRMAKMFANDGPALVDQWKADEAGAKAKYASGDRFAVVGVVFFVLSMAMFIFGCAVAYCGFSSLASVAPLHSQ